MGESKQVTFNLPEHIVEKIAWFVQADAAPSKNALVRKALELYLEKLKQDALQKAMEEAAADTMFMSDLAESMKDFEPIDQEGDLIW
ncbi:MAG: hypothetical protein PHX14_00940 [Syntrophomonadaceae bacterium]|nr:hypothetical protein [Syntrophomonadaceae bacterium]